MFFDIGHDVHGSNRPDVIDVILRPRQKLSKSSGVSLPGVQVPDPGREKLEKHGGGVFARIVQVPTIQSKAETRHSFCRGLWTGRLARNKADPSSDPRILTWKCLRSLPVRRCLLGPIAARLVV